MEKINIGTTANDFTGDSLRAAMQKINANIEETVAPMLTIKADVAAFADLATTYPAPEFGWAARVTADGFIYSWNGFAWKNTGQKNGTVVQTTGTSETDVMSQKAATDNFKDYKTVLTASDNIDNIRVTGTYIVNTALTPGTYPAGIGTYALLDVRGGGAGSGFVNQIIRETVQTSQRVWARAAYTAAAYNNSWKELTNIDTYKGVIVQDTNIDTLSEFGTYVLGSTTAKPTGAFPGDYNNSANSILVNLFAVGNWRLQLLGQEGKNWIREGTNAWTAIAPFFKGVLGASDNVDTRKVSGAALINTTLTPGTYPANITTYCVLVQNGVSEFWTQSLYEIDAYKRTSAWVRNYTGSNNWTDWVQTANPITPEPVDPSQPLYGKKMVFFGDSITEGAGGLNNYPQYVATRTGATITNVGIGGTQMANHIAAPTYNPFSFCNLVTSITTNTWTTQDANASAAGATEQLALLKTLDLSTFNFIVIAYGHNDRSNGVVVGLESSTSNDEFYGALNNSVNALLTAYPNLHIIYIAPYDRPSVPGTMQPFTDAVINVAKKNAMPVLDLLRTSGINAKTASIYLEDGLHPKLDFGYEFLGNKIGGYILSIA